MPRGFEVGASSARAPDAATSRTVKIVRLETPVTLRRKAIVRSRQRV
jgi:hypothetical protein